MAVGAVSSVSIPHHDVRWKWLLLALCATVFVTIVAGVLDYVGFGGPPWFGWWEVGASPTTQPYTAVFGLPAPGGTIDRAGIQGSDWIDLREQSTEARFGLNAQPLAKRPLSLVIHRGARRFTTRVFPRTTWDGDVRFKIWVLIPGWIASALLLSCAFLIAVRGPSAPEGRILALILLLEAVPTTSIVVPNPAATAFSAIASYACGLGAFLLLIALSSRFGTRTAMRRILEGWAYGMFFLNAAALVAFSYGLFTLRVDPLRYVPNFTVGIFTAAGLSAALAAVLAASVVAVALAAVATTEKSARPRAGWLLLPLPPALLIVNVITGLQYSPQTLVFLQTWAAQEFILILSSCALLLGAVAVTYALLKRRVLDFEFVLGRTIVVASFILLEWLLGTVLAGVSHVTGLLANAGLALVLGLSMNFIHKRVDIFVDAILFQKRREDERALLDFSKEASYATNSEALLDQAISNVRSHTDARNAAILLHEGESFTAIRCFGENGAGSISENDAAILALKAWHKPLDPHHYATSLKGALAFPMVARGRLLGVLLLGERAGGEAYPPDEVETLSEFGYGLGSALDGLLSSTQGNSFEKLQESITAAIADAMASLPHAIAMELGEGATEKRSP